MNTRRLIAVLATATAFAAGAAHAEGQTGLNSGDPIAVNPRTPRAALVVDTDSAPAQAVKTGRDAVRAEGRAAMLDELRHPGRIAENEFGPSSNQAAIKQDGPAVTHVEQQTR